MVAGTLTARESQKRVSAVKCLLFVRAYRFGFLSATKRQ